MCIILEVEVVVLYTPMSDTNWTYTAVHVTYLVMRETDGDTLKFLATLSIWSISTIQEKIVCNV